MRKFKFISVFCFVFISCSHESISKPDLFTGQDISIEVFCFVDSLVLKGELVLDDVIYSYVGVGSNYIYNDSIISFSVENYDFYDKKLDLKITDSIFVKQLMHNYRVPHDINGRINRDTMLIHMCPLLCYNGYSEKLIRLRKY